MKSTALAITRINPPNLPNTTKMGYSQISIVEPGRMAYVSGQVAWQASGAPVPSSLADQTKIVAINVRAALSSMGASPHDVVVARCYVTDLTAARMAEMMPHFMAIFDGGQPCVTGIGVEALAGPELQIEVELTVRLPM